MEAYAIFGGTAGHLAMLDPGEDLATNVIEQILEPGGRLHDEAMRFLDAFLADAAVHYSIIQAIGSGDRTWNRIASHIGKGAGSLSRPMAWLTDMELVRRDAPVTAKNPARSKQAVYRLTDPYAAFWHRFVAPLAAGGSLKAGSPAHAWRTRIAPHVDEHYGEVFEEVCRDAVWRVPGLCPFAPLVVGSWWKADSSEEVDVVAIGDDALLVGECKWGRVTGRDLANLERRAELVAADLSKRPRSTDLVLFSASGETDARVAEAAASGAVRVVDAEALFAG